MTLLFVGACSAPALRTAPCAAEPMELCKAVSSAAVLNGAELIVRGKYQSTPEYSVLFDRECRAFVNVRLAENYVETSAIHRAFARLLGSGQPVAVEVVAHGVFRAAAQGECFGGGCLPYELKVDKFLCVNEVPSAQPDEMHRPGRAGY